jgi:uncharacterized OB-fold protein
MLDCPRCLSYASMQPFELAGRGRIRDFIVATRGPSGFPVPYVQAYVELDDGPIVYSTLDCEPDDPALEVGRSVVLTGPPRAVPVPWSFRPIAADR